MATPSPFLQSPFQTLIQQEEAKPLPGAQQVTEAQPLPDLSADPVPAQAGISQKLASPAAAPSPASLLPPENLRPLFEATAAHFKVPVNVLMAITQQESGYNSDATNKETGAAGMAQYKANTANSLGINPRDPNEAVPAAAMQLRERLDKGYSIEDAIKEHFAGPDRKLWKDKTAAYGQEVLAKAGIIGKELYGDAGQDAPADAAAPSAGPEQNQFAPDRMSRADYEKEFRALNPKAADGAVKAAMAQYDTQIAASRKVRDVQGKKLGPKPILSPEQFFDARLNERLQGPQDGVVPQLPAREQPVAFPETTTTHRPGVLNQAKGDFGRGIDNLRALGYGSAGLAADATGHDAAADEFLNKYVAIQNDIAKNNPATIGTYKKVHDLGDAGRYAIEAVMENLPMILPSLVTGGAGAKAAQAGAQRLVGGMIESQVAKGIAREVAEKNAAQFIARRIMLGSAAGAAPATIGMESGSIMGDIYQDTGKKASGTAVAFGIPAGLLDTLEPVMALRKIAGPVADEVAGGIIRRLGVEAGKQFLAEAGTEAAQTYLEEMAKAKVSGKNVNRQEVLDAIIDSALKGGIGGAGMGVMSQGVADARATIGPRPLDAVPAPAAQEDIQRNQAVAAPDSRPVEQIPAPAPAAPAGPLSAAIEAAAPRPAFEASDEGFTGQILGDDGQVHTIDSRTGVIMTEPPVEPEAPAGPMEAAIKDAAVQHAVNPAPFPEVPQEAPQPPALDTLPLEDLRAQLKEVAAAAKANPEQRQELTKQRAAIEKEIGARAKQAKADSKPAEEPLSTGPFEDIKAANRMMLRYAEQTGTPHQVVGSEGKFEVQPIGEQSDGINPAGAARGPDGHGRSGQPADGMGGADGAGSGEAGRGAGGSERAAGSRAVASELPDPGADRADADGAAYAQPTLKGAHDAVSKAGKDGAHGAAGMPDAEPGTAVAAGKQGADVAVPAVDAKAAAPALTEAPYWKVNPFHAYAFANEKAVQAFMEKKSVDREQFEAVQTGPVRWQVKPRAAQVPDAISTKEAKTDVPQSEEVPKEAQTATGAESAPQAEPAAKPKRKPSQRELTNAKQEEVVKAAAEKLAARKAEKEAKESAEQPQPAAETSPAPTQAEEAVKAPAKPKRKKAAPKAEPADEQGDGVRYSSSKFSEDNRLSNLSPSGASWGRIRAANPELANVSSMDDEVTVYRATIGDTIRPDDYVALNRKTLAAELRNVRARDKGAKIITAKVRVRDLLMANDATEFVYYPDSPKYSAAHPMAKDSAREVSPLVQSLADKGAIVLHADASTLPVKGKAPSGTQALTTADGTIHVVANALGDNATGIVLHEAYHSGVKPLIGSAAWDRLNTRLGALYRQGEQSSGAARAFWDAARARVETAKAKGAVASGMEHEEFGAYAIEEYAKAPASIRKWVDDLLGAVKAWALRRFGKQLGDVTPAQLSSLAKLALLDAQAARSASPDLAPAFSVAETSPSRTLTPEEQGLLRRVQGAVQDNMNRVKQVQDRISELTGVKDLAGGDYYLAETNRPGRIAARKEDGRDKLIEPMMRRLAKAGYTPEQLSELLHAQHAEERNEAVARINPEFPDGGSGMKTAEAHQIIARYANEPKLLALADEARQIARETLEMKRAYGLITDAQYDSLATSYDNYVPLKGDGEYGPKVKRAMGHEDREEHIIENIARDFEQAIVVGEKNLARQSLLQMVLQYPDDGLWTARVPPKGRYVAGTVFEISPVGTRNVEASFTSQSQVAAWLEGKGQAAAGYEVNTSGGERVTEFTKPLQDNEVMVYVKGSPVRIQILDEKLALQLRPLRSEMMNTVLGLMQKHNRYLSTIYTGYNPAFILKNATRDAITGSINMTGNHGAVTAAKAWAKYPAAWATMLKWAVTNEIPAGKMGDHLREYRAQGGKIGASYMSDLEEQGKSLQRMFDDAKGVSGYAAEGKLGKAAWIASRKAVGGMAHAIEVLNQAFENSLRLALFAQLREQGAKPGQAAQAAKTVTVNFDRKGTATPYLGAFYLFINPAIQGTANLTNTLAHGEHKAQAWALAGMMAAAGFAAAIHGMDDDRDRWLGEKWDTRTKNLRIRVGSHTINVPLSQEYAPFYAIGVAMGEVRRGESSLRASASVLSSFLDAYYPLQGAVQPGSDNYGMDLLLAHVPTVGKMLSQIAANRNSFGNKIVPETDNTKNRPDNLKMYRGTKNSAYDASAQGIAAAGQALGADKYGNDLSKVSPETLKLIWATYTGGLGKFVADSAGLGAMVAQGSSQIEVGDMPVVKDFVKADKMLPIRSRYFDLAHDAEEAISQFKLAGKMADKTERQHIFDTTRALLKMEKIIRATNAVEAEFADKAVNINADKTLGPADKRARLKELEDKQEAIYRKAIAAFKK